MSVVVVFCIFTAHKKKRRTFCNLLFFTFHQKYFVELIADKNRLKYYLKYGKKLLFPTKLSAQGRDNFVSQLLRKDK